MMEKISKIIQAGQTYTVQMYRERLTVKRKEEGSL